MIWALIAVMLFAVCANWWDNLNTVECIAKGWVEGNSYVDWITGTNKPSLAQLVFITQGIIWAIFIAGLFVVHTPFVGAAIAGLAVAGIKHTIGGRKGYRILKEGHA